MSHFRSFTVTIGLALILTAGACDGTGGGNAIPTHGIEQREELTGLAFPDALPNPTPMQTERAFPNLAFGKPVYFAVPADQTNRNWVVDQDGRVFVFEDDDATSTKTTFLDLSGTVSRDTREEGLAGLAFSPDFASNGLFFVMYTTRDAENRIFSVLDRYKVSSGDPDVADPASRIEVLRVRQTFGAHNSGMITFGADGYLYISIGDGGSGGGGNDVFDNAQNRATLLGNILRIDVATLPYNVPADNPFVGEGGGVREEIWAYGLRNPWRFSFDRDTGDLWCADVGQHNREEVNRIQAGDNCGWPIYEGALQLTDLRGGKPEDFLAPVHDYPHVLGHAVMGGYVYRGTRVPSLQGSYVYGDHRTGRIWALVHDGLGVRSNTEIANVRQVTAFGEDRSADVIATSFSQNGSLWRFVDAGGGQPSEFPPTLSATGIFADTANLTAASGLIEYAVNEPFWSDGAMKRRWIGLPEQTRIGFSSDGSWSFPWGTVLVKHFELPLATGTTRRLETRLLIRAEQGWSGYVYRWNDEQTDADLLPAGAEDVFQVADPEAPGGVREQTWTYPARTDCLGCHTAAEGFVLGVRTQQINRDFEFPLGTDNQLRAWNHIGLFDTDIGAAGDHPAYADTRDEDLDLRTRARVYLAVNCSNCHQPDGTTGENLDLRLSTERADMNHRCHADNRRPRARKRRPRAARRKRVERFVGAPSPRRRDRDAADRTPCPGPSRGRTDRLLDRLGRELSAVARTGPGI
ncbi:MAG: PQQ-dependent sugar dehydrogenase [Planctomycetota bacterium]